MSEKKRSIVLKVRKARESECAPKIGSIYGVEEPRFYPAPKAEKVHAMRHRSYVLQICHSLCDRLIDLRSAGTERPENENARLIADAGRRIGLVLVTETYLVQDICRKTAGFQHPELVCMIEGVRGVLWQVVVVGQQIVLGLVLESVKQSYFVELIDVHVKTAQKGRGVDRRAKIAYHWPCRRQGINDCFVIKVAIAGGNKECGALTLEEWDWAVRLSLNKLPFFVGLGGGKGVACV